MFLKSSKINIPILCQTTQGIVLIKSAHESKLSIFKIITMYLSNMLVERMHVYGLITDYINMNIV